MHKPNPALLLILLMAAALFAQEQGAPIFQDTFDTNATFAENWVIGKGWSGRIKSADGKVLFPQGGVIQMRRDTPAEFCAQMDITVNGLVKGSSPGYGFCGFWLEGFRFTINNKGGYWLASAPKGACGTGLGGKIESFQPGKPVRVLLVRKVENGIAKYFFRINGKEVITRICSLKKQADGKYDPLLIFSYNIDMSIDSFGLFTVKRSDADSPNLVINSGFEYNLDGFPPYYTTPAFNPETINQIG